MPVADLYDLWDRPAVPVRWAEHAPPDDRPETVGFRDLLTRAHEIAGIAVPLPPALSALYRVLYALTARVTGLDAPDGWHERRYEVLDQGQFTPECVDVYADRYRDRLRLYDPQRPFLQDPRLAEQCDKPAGVNKLVTTRPSGSNHSWFQHAVDSRPDHLSSADALQHLLVWRYYGPSGRCSARTVGGKKEANSTAGPLRSALSYHPVGRTLFETLLAGVVEPDPYARPEVDLCPWERDDLPDPRTLNNVVTGQLSGLTARSQHALLLVPDDTGLEVRDAYITWAFRDRLPRDDDFLIWQISQAGNPYARYADSGRALWRDLDALLLKESPGKEVRRPRVFDSAVDLGLEDLRVQALGIEQEGQAKDTQLVSASTPPVLSLAEERDPEAARMIAGLRISGEAAGSRLNRATKQAWAVFSNARKAEDCAWSRDAAARYWPAAEAEFWQRLGERRFDGAARSFRQIAEGVYHQVTQTAAGTLRGAKARESARIELYGGRPKKPAAQAARTPAAAGGTETETP
ncbi:MULTISPECIES: type I-E CRISPR-associated protein Cse1/CasA [Streptomyces]|uniref:Type I-E CRISPR-associated protein Cse1/CasA n=1 Tax=Streptomyces dengpaensis TaxID=2049881 RepID=A0ABN5HVG8_9ACTN|nr:MULTISPECIES: type I-E CRISPR-associated protein Cse1/CasA [Streptomyces]AVH54571.1 type I-E CRISPR-associated protein Cse1/CasA [Streptomyces dengpaensis]PIB03455.1 type I-E CRISPR-associated protein Cse1/CasA [Streptomyces sp. HG99]